MKAKDLKNMGIDKERIKYYRREGVFTPEIPIVGNRANYTEKDVMALKQLTIFTKCGLSCGDIRRIQKGEITLSDAIVECQVRIHERMQRQLASLQLGTELLSDKVSYDNMPVDQYWDEITAREQQGEEYIDYCDGPAIDYDRTITCPYCGAVQDVDLEEFIYEEYSNPSRRDDDMGPDIIHCFDSTDAYECEKCGQVIQIKGWIREYPIGGYDSEEVDVYKGFVK